MLFRDATGGTPKQLSSSKSEWFTPQSITRPAQELLGVIDLDPASCAWANAQLVGARRFYTEADDGLSQPWGSVEEPVSVFLNPPGGMHGRGRGARSAASVWWRRLWTEREAGRLRHAVFVGFTLSILKTSQTDGPGALCCPFVICKERQRFIDESTLQPATAPTRDNVIVYVPGLIDERERFVALFGHLGEAAQPLGSSGSLGLR